MFGSITERPIDLYGEVKLLDDYITRSTDRHAKDYHTPLNWQKDSPELVIEIIVYNKESKQEGLKQREKNELGLNYNDIGTWHGHYSKLSEKKFPKRIPLRVFINNDGTYKNDTLNLLYRGQAIILTCKKSEERFKSFAEELAYKVQMSESVSKITSQEIDKSLNLTKINEKWINLD
jgi:hypothetical protein